MRSFLIKATVGLASLLVLTFVVIFVRGLAWSPNQITDIETKTELGLTQLVLQKRLRLWITRLTSWQRRELEKINPYVFTQGGCDLQAEICLVQSKTSRQGVIIRYLETKPDILKTETLWIGGFINPNDGAIYDLVGRLYKDSKSDENTQPYIDFQSP